MSNIGLKSWRIFVIVLRSFVAYIWWPESKLIADQSKPCCSKCKHGPQNTKSPYVTQGCAIWTFSVKCNPALSAFFAFVMQKRRGWIIPPGALEATAIVSRDGWIALCDTLQRASTLPPRPVSGLLRSNSQKIICSADTTQFFNHLHDISTFTGV